MILPIRSDSTRLCIWSALRQQTLLALRGGRWAKYMSDVPSHTAPTLFLLMAQYNGQTVVPLDRVCRDFFGHLTMDKLLRKALRGDIALPIVRIETSQKAQRGVHLTDLAAYIDKRRAAAIKECLQLAGTT